MREAAVLEGVLEMFKMQQEGAGDCAGLSVGELEERVGIVETVAVGILENVGTEWNGVMAGVASI